MEVPLRYDGVPMKVHLADTTKKTKIACDMKNARGPAVTEDQASEVTCKHCLRLMAKKAEAKAGK